MSSARRVAGLSSDLPWRRRLICAYQCSLISPPLAAAVRQDAVRLFLFSGYPNWHSKCSKQYTRAVQYEVAVLWIVFVILVVLWLVGLATAHTFGGFIHLLLIIALTVLLVQLM